ncbi:ImmA/IrrE family metallo-endopeptidase [Spirosoma fluminis]
MKSELELNMKREARRFRQEQGLSDSEPVAVRGLLAKLKVTALFRPLSGNFSGMAMFRDDSRFMLINSLQSIGRQNFSICHELYHLFIQKRTIAQISYAGRFPEKDIDELQADWFAAYLLVPSTGLWDNIPAVECAKDKLTIGTFLDLQHLYKCSRIVLLRSLKEENLISSAGYDRLLEEARSEQWRYGYSNFLNKRQDSNSSETSYIISDYGKLAKQLYDKQLISETDYRNALYDSGVSEEQQNDRLDEEN